MSDMFLLLAAALLVITACVHSWFGERRLIAPIIQSGAAIMKRDLARQVLRFAWHLTSLLWLVIAITLAHAALTGSGAGPVFIALVGILHVGIGVFDAILTRGRHIGWPLLTLIGVFCLLALVQGG